MNFQSDKNCGTNFQPIKPISFVLMLSSLFFLNGCVSSPPERPTSNQTSSSSSSPPVVQMSDEEVQYKVNELSNAVSNVVRGEESSRALLSELTQRMASLETEVNELHGRFEQIQHQQDRLSTEVFDLRGGIKTPPQSNQGMEVYSSQSPPSGSTSDPVDGTNSSEEAKQAQTSPTQTDQEILASVAEEKFPATAKDSYDNAFTLLKNLQYDQSLLAFNDFLKRFPEDILADNSQYWVGEIHYVQGRFPESLVAFNQVLTKWPTSDKVSGSLLKIGFSFYELGDLPNARASLDRLVKEYPNSPAVAKAQQRLQVIDKKLQQ